MKSVFLRKWDPEALAAQVPSWNFLNDPEELIPDKNLGPKINTNYLRINHVYDKTDVNFFVISDVSEKYVYHKNLFMEDLYTAMENHTEIDATYKKTHHLLIVMIIKTKELLFFPSQESPYPHRQPVLPQMPLLYSKNIQSYRWHLRDRPLRASTAGGSAPHARQP